MKKISKYLLVTTILLFIGLLVMGNYTTKKLEVKESRIYINDLKESFIGTKLVHVSDFNLKCDSDLTRLKSVVSKIARIEPDILVINGDFMIGNCKSDYNDLVSDTLQPLNKIVWKFYTLGEKDKDSTKSILSSLNFKGLNTKQEIYNGNRDHLSLIGVNNLNKAYDLDKYETVLLFAHQPDWFDNTELNNVDVAFSAHTNLGKVYLPFFNGIIKVDGASSFGYKEYESIGKLDIYTSGGVATNGYNFRLFNPPTIYFYRLDRK